MRACLVIIASILVWTISAWAQGSPADQAGAAATTEKGKAIGATGTRQSPPPPGVRATASTNAGSDQPNGPGSAGTSSNPLERGPSPGVPGGKNGVNPENGIYSATKDKNAQQPPR